MAGLPGIPSPNKPNRTYPVVLAARLRLQKLERKARKRQTGMITNCKRLNSYILVLSYVPSHRPTGDLKDEEFQGAGGFSIHSLWPAYSLQNSSGKIASHGVTTINEFDVDVNPPQIDPELVEDENLRSFWRPLTRGESLQQMLDHQASKHFKHHRLGAGRDIFRICFDHGMNFASPEGCHYLMGVIESKGYVAGNIYSCRMFVEDLSDGLQFGVKVTFRPYLNAEPSKIFYLHEVHALLDENADRIITGVKSQSFPENACFMLEDLRIRNILG